MQERYQQEWLQFNCQLDKYIIFAKGGELVMWTELYAWIEKFSGCSYNFNTDFEQIPKELIFAHPIEWRIRIINIIER